MSEITPEQIQRQFKKGADLSEVAELRLFDEKINKINNLNLVPRIKMLNLSYNQIPEIEGLKHCPDLKEINLSHNKITSVSSFAFEKNKAVTTLDLSYNQIDKFAPTSAFLKLQILNIEHNMLSSIEFVGNCKELRILNISSNKLKRIDPVDYLTKLEELNASENLIADISERNFKNHQNLTHLDLSFNHLKSITFIQSIPNITTFNCSNNKVKKVEFTRELPFLENLDLSHNEFPSLASLPKYAPNIVSLDFSDNMMLESLDMELLMDLKELREINFADNFFVTKALEEELHQQYPHLECINDRQFKRPGYYELYEIEKMKEDPEISSFVDSELGDALSRVSANDEYNVAEVRKELESKAMNAKKYENVLTSEKDFKAYMNEYQQLMQKLRIQHQSLVKGKAYLAEPTELSKEVDEELTRETQAREEVKSREVERKSTKAQTLITQSQSDKTSENGERGSYSRGKPDTPTKNLLIRTQKNFRRVEGDGAPVEKEEKKFTKTSIGFGSRAQRNVDIGSTDEILKRLQTEKENFDKLRKKTKTINIKDVMQKNYRSRIISDIKMSETIRDTNGESQNDTE